MSSVSNYTILYNTAEQYLTNAYNYVMVKNPSSVVLPNKPLNFFEVKIFNTSGKLLTIKSQVASDLIYSSIFAPHGSKSITLEPNRMASFTFVIDENSKKGIWYMLHN